MSAMQCIQSTQVVDIHWNYPDFGLGGLGTYGLGGLGA